MHFSLRDLKATSCYSEAICFLSSVPIIAFPMEERLGVAVQVSSWVLSPHALLFIVQGYEEGCPLNGIQRSLVDARAEILLPHLRPRNPGRD